MIQIPNKKVFPALVEEKQSFKQDIVDLFSGTKSAHLSSHTFGYSAHLWEDFFNTPSDYYVIKDEINLIKDNIQTIRKICQGVQNIIDLGPGSEGAVRNKTLPILKAFLFHLRQYIAIDVSKEYLAGAQSIVESEYEGLSTCGINDNFFNQQNLDVNDRSLALLFGLTLSNMPGIVDKDTGIQFLRKELRIFRNLLPQNAYFLCSFDACQNEDKLMRAYYHPKHAKFIESIAFKIKNDLGIGNGFKAEDWYYNPQWDAENHMFKHVITSKSEMDFTIDNRAFHLPKGHNILSYMSVKFPEHIYKDLFEDAGFEIVTDFFRGPQNDISIALLKAK